MKALMLVMALVAMTSPAVAGEPPSATALNTAPVAYCVERMPDGIEALDNLPPNARDVVVAKARLLEPVIWLGGRHCEGCTNDIFGTRLEITAVVRGEAEPGQVLNVFVGQRSDHRAFISVPKTPDQRSREYTVMIYLGEDGQRRLAAFPMSQSAYEKWNAEWLAYERLRMQPGFRE